MMRILRFRPAALLLGAWFMAACGGGSAPASPAPAGGFGMVIHGGAGTITRGSMTSEMEADYRAAMERSLRAGHAVLAGGGTALDAVEAAVRVMEDSPLFNAGHGAVFTGEGRNELDAAIMDGATLQAGTIAGVQRVRNPITLARMVMEQSPHVMLTREGAERFARERGMDLVDPSYFFTERRWRALENALRQEGQPIPARPPGTGGEEAALSQVWNAAADEKRAGPRRSTLPQPPLDDDRKFGTVGAVALDRNGNLAAATSTGGMTNKRWGRVGDVPIIGGGTYANGNCAVSATGHGEFFIRNVVAYDICARMEYLGLSLEEAARQVVLERLVEQGGDGGIIAMDSRGNHTLTFNSEGMYRGHIDAAGNVTLGIYRD